MIQVTREFKLKVIAALAIDRENYGGNNEEFANRHKIDKAIYSRIKSGETEKVLKDNKWLEIGRRLGVSMKERQWNVVKTDVFLTIEEQVLFCQEHSKSLIYVDDCAIGKTYALKYLARTLPNCFYIDASQAKDSVDFIRALAKEIGIQPTGKRSEIKEHIKYYLKNLVKPIVLIDEAGDFTPLVVQEIKELWNGTENECGWYLAGAEAFRVFIDRGVRNNRPGFREVFSRFGDHYGSTVPNSKPDKIGFYTKLITDVLNGNVADEDKGKIPAIVKKCLTEGEDGKIGGLRRAETLLILSA